MFPYNHTYDPFSPSRYSYEGPSYGARSDSQYLQALAEEEAARRQYAQALREQESARNRAARARLARQTYENPYYDAYLGDEDDYGFGYPSHRMGFPGSYLSPQEQRALLLERQQQQEQQRRLELLEREREKERQRIKALEEERRRQLLLEEERRRRIMLEEEERQRKREMMRRRREEEDFLRRNTSQEEAFGPLEELLGLRPRFMQPETQSNTRRARTTSPNHRTRVSEGAQNQQRKVPASPTSQAPRTPSRSPQPGRTSIPINSPRSSPRPEERKPSPPPRRFTPEEVTAAEMIQQFWRTHHQRRAALASIAEAAAHFEEIKSRFALPTALDYTFQGQQVSVPTVAVGASSASEVTRTEEDAKLAYTPNNAPVHVYEEELNRILTKLDGVQSGGDQEVRNKRRELVRRVEMEAERIENVKILVWRAWVSRSEDDQGSEMQMEESVSESSQPASEPVEPKLPEQMDVDDTLVSSQEPSSSPAACDALTPTEQSNTTAVAEVDVEAMDVEPQDSTIPSAVTQDVQHSPSATLPDSDENPSTDAAPRVEEPMEVSEESYPDTIVVEEPSSEDANEDSSDAAVTETTKSGLAVVTSSLPDHHSDAEHSSASEPGLDFSPSDGDITPPRTPPASHEHLQDTPADSRKDSTPQVRPLTTTERLQLLRPLFDREWEEEFDLF